MWTYQGNLGVFEILAALPPYFDGVYPNGVPSRGLEYCRGVSKTTDGLGDALVGETQDFSNIDLVLEGLQKALARPVGLQKLWLFHF